MIPSPLVLFSIGYEGFPTVEDLVHALGAAGIERVVDVRDQPQSRRPGFSRRALESALADAGIAYEHRRELGNPAAIRALYRSGEAERGREAYRAQLLGERAWALDALATAAAERPTAMLCLEADQARCHRDVIAEELARRCDLRQHPGPVASYSVNDRGVAHARRMIEARQYVLRSDWGAVQPGAADENAFLESHSWDEYSEWHLGLTGGATDRTKARYAFVYGDFRRVHRSGLIACVYRASEWRHKEVELAAHDLLQVLDRTSG